MKIKMLHMLLFCSLSSTSLHAQVSNYTLSSCMIPFDVYSFKQETTFLGGSIHDVVMENTLYNGSMTGSTENSLTGQGFNIGFPFFYDGEYFDRFAISTNGFIKLGKSSEGDFTICNERKKGSVFQSGLDDMRKNTISAFQINWEEDFLDASIGVKTSLTGTPGNRCLTIQWSSGGYKVSTNAGRNYYLRLFEKDGTILMAYQIYSMEYQICTGSWATGFVCIPGTITSLQSAIGLRGNQPNNDMNNLNIMKVTKGENTWQTPLRGTSSTDFCYIEKGFMPLCISSSYPLPTTDCEYFYRWTPPYESIVKDKPQSPYTYFTFIENQHWENNGYHFEKIPEDNGAGNTYSVVKEYTPLTYYTYANGAKAVPVNKAVLSWDKALGVDNFDVYFGLTNPPPLVASNTTDTTYTPIADLAPGTTYYYNVVAKNTNGNSGNKIGAFTTAGVPTFCVPDLNSLKDLKRSYCFGLTLNTLKYQRNKTTYLGTFYMPENVYTTSLKRGQTYNYELTIHFYDNLNYPLSFLIDWNKNGVLDSGELYDGQRTNNPSKPSDAKDSWVFTGTVTVPMDAQLGKTVLRVAPSSIWEPVRFCDSWAQFIVNVLPSEDCENFTLSYNTENTLCYGENSGHIQLLPQGGTIPYTINWTDGNQDAERNNLSTGTYQATVIDHAGCDQTTPLLAIQSPFLIQMDTITVDNQLEIYIFGGTGSYLYQCTKDGAPFGISQTMPVLSEVGTYSLTVTDENNCTRTFDNIVITDNSLSKVPVVGVQTTTLNVYPNPTAGAVNITSENRINNIEIFNISGKIVFNRNYSEKHVVLNMEELPNGVYLVKALTGKGIECAKVVK